MRYFILMALVSLTSSMAFANASENDRNRDGDDHHRSVNFECSFRTGKKGNVSCTAEGTACLERREHGEAAAEPFVSDEKDKHDCSKLRVECTDGFRIFDRDPRVVHEGNDLFIESTSKGRRNHRAEIEIEDFNREGGTFTAELSARRHRGVPIRLTGSCEIQAFGRDHDHRDRDDN